ncbi:hypothetical protein BC834DRAFT_447423 [Gloeopeniophorella convolvens]|nr:hypothetical protein BC834DRAFT_447423 [Gloeopeniophorella convolvens]
MPTEPETEVDICATQRQEEWEVLLSIYPDCVSGDPSSGALMLEIPVELGGPTDVFVTGDGSADSPVSHEHHLSLSSLPPILLEIMLPPTYPLHAAPKITSFHVTSSWIPRASLLRDALAEMWHPGETVLYSWVEWIRSADFLDTLGMVHGATLRIPHVAPQLLLHFLTAHESQSQTSKFNQTSHSCAVCFESRKGSQCLELLCGHVFCRACLRDGWSLYIAEGEVTRVGCLDPQCVKGGQEASEEEVRRVVTEEEVRRWRWLKEKKAAEKDPTMVLCPMFLCQTPVPGPSNIDAPEESGWERLRTCQACDYSFCSFCKRTWHGPLSDCPIPVAEKVILQYMETKEGSPARKEMEQRYGRRNLTKLVAKYEEDRANREWLEKSTMACPGCHVPVEKSVGCNHMTCAKCKQHFCYRCGAKLEASNPYKHFSTPREGCYSKLFDFEGVDGWDPMDGFVVVEGPL